MIVSILFLFILVAEILWVKPLFDRQKGMRTRWEPAVRHFLAAVVGLFAFVFLFGILQVLDLFERQYFSWRSLLDILQVSLIVLAIGGMAAIGSVAIDKK
jgi:hypothetical protein